MQWKLWWQDYRKPHPVGSLNSLYGILGWTRNWLQDKHMKLWLFEAYQ